jgi:Tfp pilus assembly protein FimV
MNLFLSLLFVTLAGIAYMAFTIQQQTSAGFSQRLSVWQDRVDELQSDNKKLQENIAMENAKEANWSAQLKNAQAEIAARNSPTAASVESSESNPAAHATTSALNDLGTIVTITGKDVHPLPAAEGRAGRDHLQP